MLKSAENRKKQKQRYKNLNFNPIFTTINRIVNISVKFYQDPSIRSRDPRAKWRKKKKNRT